MRYTINTCSGALSGLGQAAPTTDDPLDIFFQGIRPTHKERECPPEQVKCDKFCCAAGQWCDQGVCKDPAPKPVSYVAPTQFYVPLNIDNTQSQYGWQSMFRRVGGKW
jgi:hypothetical protein